MLSSASNPTFVSKAPNGCSRSLHSAEQRLGSRRGFTLPELTLSTAIFTILLVVLALALSQISRLTLRTSTRDEAVAQILKARLALQRDLGNAGSRPGQFASASVGPSVGSGIDGHALSFLSSDNGDHSDNWNPDPNTGESTPAVQITYYLVIPNVSNQFGITPNAGAPDAQGHEQQFPLKWLIRRVDPATAGALDAGWTSWLVRPTGPITAANEQLISNRLFQFKVLASGPVWTLEISAVGVQEAGRKLALGNTPLAGSPFVVTQQFSVRAENP